jgi:hypothetical protein
MLRKVYPHLVPTIKCLTSAGYVFRILLQADARLFEKYVPRDFVAFEEGVVLNAMQTNFKLFSSLAAGDLITWLTNYVGQFKTKELNRKSEEKPATGQEEDYHEKSGENEDEEYHEDLEET